ncbi:MAG: Spo0B domain-containing protein [Bacillota bacterium]|nr:Spo0B domain-containing protein [Bacillota bacterium]
MKRKLNIDKTIITIIVLSIVQVLCIICAFIYKFFNKGSLNINGKYYNDNAFLILVGIIGIINSVFVIRDIKIIYHGNIEYEMVKCTLEQEEKLNKTLRGQRHDFMNHLQVVYSLMELEDYDASKDYIEKVYNDIQKINKILKTLNPAVNALLQAKNLYAEKRGIKIELNITTQLSKLQVPSWEFCRILSNIIDNAIFALKEIEKPDKVISIEIFKDLKIYGFRIRNNGPKIPENIQNKIFEAGITTKGDKGDGMGLAIVKEILNSYGGDVKVESNDNFTTFEGWVTR